MPTVDGQCPRQVAALSPCLFSGCQREEQPRSGIAWLGPQLETYREDGEPLLCCSLPCRPGLPTVPACQVRGCGLLKLPGNWNVWIDIPYQLQANNDVDIKDALEQVPVGVLPPLTCVVCVCEC